MLAASRAASAVPCLRKAAGPHAAGPQPARHHRAEQQNSCGGHIPLGLPQLFCCAAGWCLAGCGTAACGPAAFPRQGTADVALLSAGMHAGMYNDHVSMDFPVNPFLVQNKFKAETGKS